jgi:hypothetical protein
MSRNETDHYIYPPTEEELTRVTSVLDGTEGKRFLVPWSAKLAAERAVDDIATVLELLKTEGPAPAGARRTIGQQAAVDYLKTGAEEDRGLKADVGSYVHSVVEALILWQADEHGSDLVLPGLPGHLQGAEYDDEPVEDVAEWMIDGFLAFTADYKPVFQAAEMTVFNYGLGVAGTLDMIADLPGLALGPTGRNIPGPGVRACIDVKTGRNPGVTWREQIAAYRRMTECLLPMGELHPMPPTDCGAVLHLRPEYRDGYKLHGISAAGDAGAWNTFRRAVKIYRDRKSAKAKPGKVWSPLRADGTIRQPLIADLDGEGYGRVISPLVKAGVADLEQLAAMSAGDCLKVKRVGGKVLDQIRVMLADHGLHLADEAPATLAAVA